MYKCKPARDEPLDADRNEANRPRKSNPVLNRLHLWSDVANVETSYRPSKCRRGQEKHPKEGDGVRKLEKFIFHTTERVKLVIHWLQK